ELTADADRLPDAFNLHFGATREGDGIPASGASGGSSNEQRELDGVRFEHEVREGPATASYGVEVAQTAGVPESVVDRAREFLDAPDVAKDEEPTDFAEDGDTAEVAEDEETAVDSGDGVGQSTVEQELRDLDLAELTPIEALNVLHDLKRDLD
ncbi:MAG: hypothetical protein ABEH83_00470, partial [Halobacterium sp.]